MNVDFPHPEGPIIAVTAFPFIVKFMSFKACFEPNHAFKVMLCIFMSDGICSRLTVVSSLLLLILMIFIFLVDLGLPL